jgi:hypothetical protein
MIRCPRCGSEEKEVRRHAVSPTTLERTGEVCPDSWHDTPAESKWQCDICGKHHYGLFALQLCCNNSAPLVYTNESLADAEAQAKSIAATLNVEPADSAPVAAQGTSQPSSEGCGSAAGGGDTPETDSVLRGWTDGIVMQSRLLPAEDYAALRDKCRALERQRDEARREADALRKEAKIMRAEKDAQSARADYFVQYLVKIHGFVQPKPMEHEGKIHEFMPPDLPDVWRSLSKAIREIPDVLNKDFK